MDFSEWLDKHPGSVKAMADHFGVTHSAVSQWRGNGVPLLHMQAVHEFTSGAVTLAEMTAVAVAAAKKRANERDAKAAA